MNNIDFETDRVDSVTQIDQTKNLSDKVIELRRLLKNYTSKDFLLLSGDPAIIGLACTIASDINSGRFNLLKWDRQEKVYYPLEINLYEKGEIDE